MSLLGGERGRELRLGSGAWRQGTDTLLQKSVAGVSRGWAAKGLRCVTLSIAIQSLCLSIPALDAKVAPSGGFGLNTGLQHAHNLSWKLAAVLRNLAPEVCIFAAQWPYSQPVYLDVYLFWCLLCPEGTPSLSFSQVGSAQPPHNLPSQSLIPVGAQSLHISCLACAPRVPILVG